MAACTGGGAAVRGVDGSCALAAGTLADAGRSAPRWATRRQPPSRTAIPREKMSVRICSLRHGLFVELQRQLQIARLVPREGHRVRAGVTRAAVRLLIRCDGAQHALEAEV